MADDIPPVGTQFQGVGFRGIINNTNVFRVKTYEQHGYS